MLQQICSQCRATNPMPNRYCGQCGAALSRLAARRNAPLVVRKPGLPTPQLKQIGQTVAVGLLAIAAEAGLKWLQRKLNEPETIEPRQRKRQTAVQPTPLLPQQHDRGATAVFQQETVETQQWTPAGWVRRTVTRAVWWRP